MARIPRVLRPPAVVVRHIVHIARNRRRPYVYESDGLATVHHSPFLQNTAFNALYQHVHSERSDIRWRVWILLQCVRQAATLNCSIAEFGVYRGSCAFLMLSELELRDDQHVYLFDTFAGIPQSRLTKREEKGRFAGRWADTSTDDVAHLLREWPGHVNLVPGDVFDTLPRTETGPLAFAHVDLNASAPTKRVLEYVYPRLVGSGMMVLDDYGWEGYEDQRKIIDDFFQNKPESIIALPTGQALVVKTPEAP